MNAVLCAILISAPALRLEAVRQLAWSTSGQPEVAASESDAPPADSDAAQDTDPKGADPKSAAADAEAEPNKNWADISHGTVERGINALVLKLDRFFGEQNHAAYEPPSSHIRLRNEVRSAEDDSLQARTAIAADIQLPAADQLLSRFSVLITGETEPQAAPDAEVDRDPPRFDARLQTAGGALEFRYDLFRASRTLVDAGAGVRFDLPPPPYTRLRLSQGFPLGAGVEGHLSQSLFWDEREGFGEATRLDIHRAFGTRTLARWWAIGTVDEVSLGYEWASEIGVQRALGPRTALYSAAAIAGATRAVADVERYRIFSRVRRDVYRGWAFLEVEPEISWPADDVTGERSRVLGLILRLEIQFSTGGVSPVPLARAPGADVPGAPNRSPEGA